MQNYHNNFDDRNNPVKETLVMNEIEQSALGKKSYREQEG